MFTNSQVHYLARESLRSFYQMKGIAMVSTLIMSVALLMLTLFTLLTVNLQAVVQVFQSEIEIVAFLEEGQTNETVQEMQQRILQNPGVASVSFVSKAEALEEFRAQLGTDADLLEVLEENPLPASLRLRLQEEARTSERLELLACFIQPVVLGLGLGEGVFHHLVHRDAESGRAATKPGREEEMEKLRAWAQGNVERLHRLAGMP